MECFIKCFLIFIVVVIIRFLITKDDLKQSEKLLSKLQAGDNENLSNFVYKRLIKRSGIPTPHFSELMNGSIIPSEKIDDQFPCKELRHCFEKRLICVHDVFSERYKQNFSPIFWINSIVFLPRNVLVYLGVSEDNIATKIVTIFFWLGTFVIALIKASLIKFLQHLLNI